MGWMLNPFLFLFLFPSARGPKFSGSASHIARRKKWQPVAKVGRDQMHLVPMISIVGGDASHGSVPCGGCAYV